MVKGTHSKGKAIERAFAEYLRAEGIAVDTWVPQAGKYASNDIFGLFDVIYISKWGPICFVQICHPNSIARHRRAIDVWMKEHDWPYINVELWTYDKVRIFQIVKAW